MTNYEHYKDEIEKITRLGYEIAVDKNNNKPCACDNLLCSECIANTKTCFETISKWADEEYIEPTQQVGWPKVDWSKVPVDTPVLVKVCSDGNWIRRYFAKYQNGYVYTFDNGATSWSSNNEGTTSWNFAKLAEGEKK
nr:MAG TPA: hypothetical protein [Caudoviricetes sp.]